MGHKVHPTGFRLGVIKGWESRWYAERNYKDLLAEDQQIRKLIARRLANAGVSRIEIERVAGTQLSVTIHTAKPGIVIGKSGESVERLRQLLETTTKKKVRLTILEIRNPEVESVLVARSIAEQLEKRISFRRAMKQAVQKAMRANARGIKVVCGGRLGGAEIARVEKEVEGSVPLQTLRADIDYGQAEAHTTYGVVGIKVWIYKGDVLPEKQRELGPNATESQAAPAGAGEFGSRSGGDRGTGRGGPRSDRGDRAPRRTGERPAGGRTASAEGERRPARPRSGGPGTSGAASSRPAPTSSASAERGPRASRPSTPGVQQPASEQPPVTPDAHAAAQTQAEPRTSEVQSEAPSQASAEMPRPEEEPGS